MEWFARLRIFLDINYVSCLSYCGYSVFLPGGCKIRCIIRNIRASWQIPAVAPALCFFMSVALVNLCWPDSSLNTLWSLGSEANYREFIAARSILVMVSFSIAISRMTGNFFSCFFYGFLSYFPYCRDIIWFTGLLVVWRICTLIDSESSSERTAITSVHYEKKLPCPVSIHSSNSTSLKISLEI